MFSRLPKYFEFRLLAILGSAALALYLFNTLWTVSTLFSYFFLILILSWLLAFIFDPLAEFLIKKGVKRLPAAFIIYIGLTILFVGLIYVVLPTTIAQLSNLTNLLPSLFEKAPGWATRFEGIISSTLANSVTYAQNVASFLIDLLLVAFVSFYFLLGRDQIKNYISQLVPDQYRQDYDFILRILNKTLVSFLRVQLIVGLLTGTITLIILLFFSVEFSLSAAILSGLLAMVPVVGPVVAIFPPVLAAATSSWQKGIISGTTLFLAKYYRINVTALTLGPATSITVNVIGKQ